MSTSNQSDENNSKNPTKPNKNKMTILIILGTVTLIVLAVVLGIYLKKDADYNRAVEMMAGSDAAAAKEMFADLNGFKDSEQNIVECDYLLAKDTFAAGDYQQAAALFALLDDYKDSEAFLNDAENYIQYHDAIELFENEEYEAAKILFSELNDFDDAMHYVLKCQLAQKYNQAIELMASGSNEQAKLFFEELADYKDSITQALICGYRIMYADAVNKIETGNFIEAWEILNKINSDFLDNDLSLDIVANLDEFNDYRSESYKYVAYAKGIQFYEEGLYYDAYKKFVRAGDILDAEDRAQLCMQPFSTKEIYHNPDYVSNECTVVFRSQSDYTYNECIKVVTNGGDLVSTIAIQPGKTITIHIPEGVYMIVGGKGNMWFGDEDFFGEDGSYYKVQFPSDEGFMGNRNYKLFFSIFITTIDIGEGQGNLSSYEVSYAYFVGQD